MKLYQKLPLTFFILLFSCHNDSQNNNQTKENGGGFLKNSGSVYNGLAIDSLAAVSEIELSSSGNTMSEMKFDKDTLKVKRRTTVKLTFNNASTDMAMMHNFVLIDPGTAQAVADLGLKAGKEKQYVPDISAVYVSTKMTSPGETTTILFPAPAAGNYMFICTYPGHYSVMQGVFIVE